MERQSSERRQSGASDADSASSGSHAGSHGTGASHTRNESFGTKFQVKTALSSPRSSVSSSGACSVYAAAGARRGGWRGSTSGRPHVDSKGTDRAPASQPRPSSSSGESFQRPDSSPSDQSPLETPTGVLPNLPSILDTPTATGPPSLVQRNSSGSITSSNYDWANFVHAYARGKWDPHRLPHPPVFSTAFPGMRTRIEMDDDHSPMSMPEGNQASSSSSKAASSSTMPISYFPPVADTRNPTASPLDTPSLAAPELPAPSKSFTGPTGMTTPLYPDETSSLTWPTKASLERKKTMPPPSPTTGLPPVSDDAWKFDPTFALLHVASSSSPEIGVAVAAGAAAQAASAEMRPFASAQSGGAKSTPEMIPHWVEKGGKQKAFMAKEMQPDDSVWQGGTWEDEGREGKEGTREGPAGAERSSKGSTSDCSVAVDWSREVPTTRPRLPEYVSEMVLSAAGREVYAPPQEAGKDGQGSASAKKPPEPFPTGQGDAEGERDELSIRSRPGPTPVQHPMLTLSAELPLCWQSAPEGSLRAASSAMSRVASQAMTDSSATFSSSSGMFSADSMIDSSTVSGLRRAARRTSASLERAVYSRGGKAGPSVPHSASFPGDSPRSSVSQASVGTSQLLASPSTSGSVDSSGAHDIHSLRNDLLAKVELAHEGKQEDYAEGGSRLSHWRNETSLRARTGSDPKTKAGGPPQLKRALTQYVTAGREAELFYQKNGYLPTIRSPNELARRQALRRFGLPKLSGNVNFDRLAHLVKLVFNSKAVLISLVGETEQIFQSEVGGGPALSIHHLQKIASARDCSFCSHSILQDSDEPVVVLDASRDWRFRQNPLVVSSPNIRFYAGSPLRTSDGHNIGSLCLIDDRPWEKFDPRQRHTLREFARVVMREMELWRDKVSTSCRVRGVVREKVRDRVLTLDDMIFRLNWVCETECSTRSSSSQESASRWNRRNPTPPSRLVPIPGCTACTRMRRKACKTLSKWTERSSLTFHTLSSSTRSRPRESPQEARSSSRVRISILM